MSNISNLTPLDRAFAVDEVVFCTLKDELVRLVLSLPTVTVDAENPHETMRSAIAAMHKVIKPDPVLTPEQQLAAKVAAHTKAVVENPKLFENARVDAWSDFYADQSIEFADSADDYTEYQKKFAAIQSAWSSMSDCYENLPSGLVPEGWPETYSDPQAYIAREAERSLAPPGDETEPLPEDEVVEEEVVADTEMHRMLERLSQPAQPPTHD